MKNAIAAFKFLTISDRLNGSQLSPEQIGSAALYFPLVGLMLGCALVPLNWILEPYLGSEILAAVHVMTLILMTGAIQLEGTQKTFDTLRTGTNFGSAAGKPSGTYGLLALMLVVLFKIRAIEVIGETRHVVLLLAPIFARWALVIFLYGASSVAGGSMAGVAERVKGWHLLLTTTATLALGVYLGGRVGLWVGLCLSLFALLSRSYLQRRKGGINYDNFGAVIELSETLSFVLLASL